MIRLIKFKWLIPLLLLAAFLASIFLSREISVLLARFLPNKGVFAERTPLPQTALQHITLVVAASGLSFVAAIAAAVVTRVQKMQRAESFLIGVATLGQLVPTVAVLALLVPLLGYGSKPILAALFLYGVLPVLRNTLEGLESLPLDVVESARAMGMSPLQALFAVELPLVKPAIAAGLRVSIILNISVATVGAVVGLNSFGTLIINGIRADDAVMLIRGALPVSLLALFVDSLFSAWLNEPAGN